ncbi:MAG: efflux RND transporter periplasmic adaptor subunit [Syntrophotaleaceae bacterium]
MNLRLLKKSVLMVLLILGVLAGWLFFRPDSAKRESLSKPSDQPIPVEVVDIVRGPMELRRTFSGALEAPSEFVVAPKVSGRVERLKVNLADQVSRGQVVAEMDNDEYVQEVAQARAELAVAEANRAEARSALEIADRDLDRATRLRQRGVASEADLDTARANKLAKQAQLEVARAGVTRARAALETARIRLGYTKITADWNDGSGTRVVAERFVNEGQTVSANTSLLRIVELDPLTGVIFVSEKDYGQLRTGQAVTLTTDAYPGQTFKARIERIAPVFREATRQARVELSVANPERQLKPGMFIRATIVLDRAADAVIVPDQALTSRRDRTGIFLVAEDSRTVHWREVRTGIREEGRVQILDPELSGQVVTLGQQLVEDGSPVIIPTGKEAAGRRGEKRR